MAINRIEQVAGNEGYIIEALNHILVMVREKMLLEFHVEKFNLFVDTDDAGVIKSLDKFLERVYQNIRLHFA